MYTNYSDIPLPLAVWLASDRGYDLKPNANTVSATTLMQPTRSVILTQRVMQEQQSIDVADLVQAKVGTAVHEAVEDAWLYGREKAMRLLNIPNEVISKIALNPERKWDGDDDIICIYMEQRTNKEIDGWVVSGKFDIVWENRVCDIKTTKTYNWIKGSNDEKYALQGSIYRWLNPEIIKDDFIDIYMIFTDWSPLKAQADKTYPPKRVIVRRLPLLSIEETESWIRGRLAELTRYKDADQADLPACTPEELWMDPPKWAYYKDKTKTTRATKLFDTAAEAHARLQQDGAKGLVTKREMEPTFCRYCSARPVCTQAEQYIAQGLLKI
jgi:hypothetical protein